MTDHTELVEALRCGTFGDDECGNSDCPYWSGLGCMDGIATEEAADAIEELNKNWKYCSDMLNLALKVSGLSMTALVKLYETEVQK